MRITTGILLAALSTVASAQFLDLNRDAGVGVSAHQWALQRKVASGMSLRQIVRDWKEIGARVVRINTVFTDHAFEKQFLAACKAEKMTVLLAGFDYNPVGIENHLPSGWWPKLKSAFGEDWKARTIAVQLVKGLHYEDGIDFLVDGIKSYRFRNRAYLGGAWASAGNDVENAGEYVFHNRVGEPERAVADSSKYAGWSQILNKGTHNPGIRGKLESVLNTRLPNDNQFMRNTARAEDRLRAAWGGKWLDGANHGYWSRAHNGKPYFGDVGSQPNAEVYTEYGLYAKQLPGRYDLLEHAPPNARILIFWPGDGDPFKDLTDVPEIRRIIKETSFRLAAQNRRP